jgi:hypothetical protein
VAQPENKANTKTISTVNEIAFFIFLPPILNGNVNKTIRAHLKWSPRQEPEAPYNNATSRVLHRIPSPAEAGEFQTAGLKIIYIALRP